MRGGGTQSLLENIKLSIKRVGRLYPLHLVFFVLALVYLLITHQLSSDLLLLKSLSNLLLIQSLVPISDFYYSFNGVSWYLSITLILYVAFPYIRRLIKDRKPISMTLILFFVMTAYGGLVCFIPCSVDVKKWLVYINPFFRSIDFTIGSCAGLIIKNCCVSKSFRKISGVLFLVLSAYSIVLFGILKTNENFIWLIYSLIYTPAIFFGLLNLGSNEGSLSKILSFKPFVWIGNISGYAFLIHQMAILYIGSILSKIGFGGPLKIIIAFVVTIALAVIYDWMVRKTNQKTSR